MCHRPIEFRGLSFRLPHKICFADFNATIRHGQRIAIIGRNGSGKSTLLNLIQDSLKAQVAVRIDSVPQVIEKEPHLSGGQRFNRMLSVSLSRDPDILLLDEPTNHLDRRNRRSLIRMLKSFRNTLIVATHDVELLRELFSIIWHIDQSRLDIFSGTYDCYVNKLTQQRVNLEQQIASLHADKVALHHSLMREQARAKSSRRLGQKHVEQRKWPTIVSSAKARRAEQTSGRKRRELLDKKNALREELASIPLPEIITPSFHLASNSTGSRIIASIHEGSIAYGATPLIDDISLVITYGERIALLGDNASGKSSLLKALLDDPSIKRTGAWNLPSKKNTGYVGQHYETIDAGQTVVDTIKALRPTWDYLELRKLLNQFLFRKNEEVNALVRTLSGGEKARLSLCMIAAHTPRLLILDEISNNIDIQTREHMIQVLQAFPGALFIVSHDEDFLQALKIENYFTIKDGKFINKAKARLSRTP